MWKNKLSSLLKSPKIVRISVIVGIVAIALIFLSSVISFPSLSDPDAKLYSEQIRTELTEILSGIDGVGELSIFLTMDNAGENVYLSNSDTKTKSIEPTVRGVVIVCDGGDDAVVVGRVLDAVTKSLSISSDRVCVTKKRQS